MPQTINDVTPSGTTARVLSVAVEVSTRSRGVGISSPNSPDTIRIHTPGAGDAPGLMARIRKARDPTPDRILRTHDVGHDGVWLAGWRHQEAPDIAIVMGDPARLEVVRRARVAKTTPSMPGAGCGPPRPRAPRLPSSSGPCRRDPNGQ